MVARTRTEQVTCRAKGDRPGTGKSETKSRDQHLRKNAIGERSSPSSLPVGNECRGGGAASALSEGQVRAPFSPVFVSEEIEQTRIGGNDQAGGSNCRGLLEHDPPVLSPFGRRSPCPQLEG